MKWKILFWLYVVNTILSTLAIPRYPNVSIFDGIHLAIYYTMAIPLYGIAHNKKLLSQNFWKYYFVTLCGANLLYSVAFRVLEIPRFGHTMSIDVTIVIEWIFIVPFLLGIYFYSKNINQLKAHNKKGLDGRQTPPSQP